MGLADRDYMRNRRRAGNGVDVTDVSFLRPREERSAALILTIVLMWLLLRFALYKGASMARPPTPTPRARMAPVDATLSSDRKKAGSPRAKSSLAFDSHS
jgi:hypothetical protein